MELTIEGVAAIQAGSNPRLVAEKLKSLLPATKQDPRRPDHVHLHPVATRRGHAEEEHEEGSERWLVTYADMVTLLMVLFIIMFAMSTVDTRKYQALKNGLANGFGTASTSSTVPTRRTTTPALSSRTRPRSAR